MTAVRSHDAVARTPVHIGAACYAAGPLVPLEEAISDEAMRARLRNPNHGSDTFPQWDHDIADLAESAITQCMASAGRQASQIDAVFLTSNGLDARNNLDGSWLGVLDARLGLCHAPHYQLGMAGCAGFHWAAKLATGLIESGQCDHILVASFDKAQDGLQRLYAENPDFPYLTGDAAAACIFSSSPASLDYRLVGRVINKWDGRQAIRTSLEEEVRCIARLIDEALESAAMRAEEIDLLISNNYSLDISRLYCQIAGLDYAKAFTRTIASHAHCFGSDNLINLHHTGRLAGVGAGQKTMLFSAGPFQWGACLLERTSVFGEGA